MAKQEDTGITVARTVRVGGRRRVGADGRVELTVEVDGRSTTTTYEEATHQEAIYVATVKAMRRADADAVTLLEIDSPNNLVKGHMAEDWKRREKRLTPFQEDIARLMERFDDVEWL